MTWAYVLSNSATADDLERILEVI